MIRCKQKGPHQQVRFRLSLSVLPTAPGITYPAGPAHSPSARALPLATQEGANRPAGRGLGHHPGGTPAPRRSLYEPHRMVTRHSRVFLELPPTWDPGTPTLESHNPLQSGPFQKPEDPHQDLEVCAGLREPGQLRPRHSLPTKKGHPLLGGSQGVS